MVKLLSVGEKEIIRSYVRPLFNNSLAEVGIGDDAAVIKLNDDISLVMTIDRIPDDLIAYKYGVMNEKHLGKYLVVASLSDLAAMGSIPLAMMSSLVMPNDFTISQLKDLLNGINEESIKYNAPVVGGDTKGGPFKSFTLTAIGTIQPKTSLTRKGAKVGDKIYTTGKPGQFGTALAYLLVAKPNGLNLQTSEEQILFRKFTDPTARIEQGNFLRNLGIVRGCQDVSDGISQTVKEIAEANDLGFILETKKLKQLVTDNGLKIARACRCDIEDIILGPGADFELIFGLNPSDAPFVEKEFKRKGWELYSLGEFTKFGFFIVDENGKRRNTTDGFVHFSGLKDDKLIAKTYSLKNR